MSTSTDEPPTKSWRCFHCDEFFTDPKEAATHFGGVQGAQPLCKFDGDEIRHMEWCLAKYRDEDTDLHRQIASLQGEHTQALMRAEEAGYAKGLKDGRELGLVNDQMVNIQNASSESRPYL